MVFDGASMPRFAGFDKSEGAGGGVENAGFRRRLKAAPLNSTARPFRVLSAEHALFEEPLRSF